MTLLGVEKQGDERTWLYSEWRLTYRVGWEPICKAVALIYEYTDDPEVRAGDANGNVNISVRQAGDIRNLDEHGRLEIRGWSQMIHAPVQISFFNQTDLVRVSVLSVNEEFSEADYKAFNLSMGQFMDSIEIVMHS